MGMEIPNLGIMLLRGLAGLGAYRVQSLGLALLGPLRCKGAAKLGHSFRPSP